MTRRLQLNRETLLRLDNGHLGGIVGGVVNTLNCVTYATCEAGTCISKTLHGSIGNTTKVAVVGAGG